jgi:hypothetical protein
MVASTYAAAHPKTKMIKNVVNFLLLCFGATEYDGLVLLVIVGVVVLVICIAGAIIGVTIGGSHVWNVDPGTWTKVSGCRPA